MSTLPPRFQHESGFSHEPRVRITSEAATRSLGSGPAPSHRPALRLALWLAAAATVVGLLLYTPAFQGPFVFDDSGLPFYTWDRELPVSAWVSGVRPGLMFTYWLNRALWGDSPVAYHAANLAIHLVNCGLVFLVLWRLLGWAGWDPVHRKRGAVLGATLFLVHPLQTESVSYIAGRSESLSALFVLLALRYSSIGENPRSRGSRRSASSPSSRPRF